MNRKVITFFVCLSILLALTNIAKTQSQTGDSMETFFDSEISKCLRIQVNATSRAQPASSISVAVGLTSLVTKVHVKIMNLTICGFVNGTERREIYNNLSRDIILSKTNQVTYLHQVSVPENVYGVICGSIYLKYDATVIDELGNEHQYPFEGPVGFTMTRVENVYLKSLEEQIKSLKEQINSLENQLRDVYSFIDGLNQTFRDCFGKSLTRDELLNLNQTLWELQRDYETLKGVKSELDNTRTAMVFLAVVAVFFVATTAYLVFRKPKDYW
ncbi:MAG: hypothetical protein QW734_06775 [Candidatus Bathyarchaeia archaeon]